MKKSFVQFDRDTSQVNVGRPFSPAFLLSLSLSLSGLSPNFMNARVTNSTTKYRVAIQHDTHDKNNNFVQKKNREFSQSVTAQIPITNQTTLTQDIQTQEQSDDDLNTKMAD